MPSGLQTRKRPGDVAAGLIVGPLQHQNLTSWVERYVVAWVEDGSPPEYLTGTKFMDDDFAQGKPSTEEELEMFTEGWRC